MSATYRRVATVHRAWISVVAVSRSTGLASAATAMVADGTSIVVVAGDRGRGVIAGPLGAGACAVVDAQAGG